VQKYQSTELYILNQGLPVHKIHKSRGTQEQRKILHITNFNRTDYFLQLHLTKSLASTFLK